MVYFALLQTDKSRKMRLSLINNKTIYQSFPSKHRNERVLRTFHSKVRLIDKPNEKALQAKRIQIQSSLKKQLLHVSKV